MPMDLHIVTKILKWSICMEYLKTLFTSMILLNDYNMNFYCRSQLNISSLMMLLSMDYQKKQQMSQL